MRELRLQQDEPTSRKESLVFSDALRFLDGSRTEEKLTMHGRKSSFLTSFLWL